jgi:hypothetical protein
MSSRGARRPQRLATPTHTAGDPLLCHEQGSVPLCLVLPERVGFIRLDRHPREMCSFRTPTVHDSTWRFSANHMSPLVDVFGRHDHKQRPESVTTTAKWVDCLPFTVQVPVRADSLLQGTTTWRPSPPSHPPGSGFLC